MSIRNSTENMAFDIKQILNKAKAEISDINDFSAVCDEKYLKKSITSFSISVTNSIQPKQTKNLSDKFYNDRFSKAVIDSDFARKTVRFVRAQLSKQHTEIQLNSNQFTTNIKSLLR